MKSFTYTLTDPAGLGTIQVSQLVQEVRKHSDDVFVKKADKTALGTSIMALTELAAKCGDTITVEVDGTTEADTLAALKALLEASF